MRHTRFSFCIRVVFAHVLFLVGSHNQLVAFHDAEFCHRLIQLTSNFLAVLGEVEPNPEETSVTAV